MYKYKQTIVNCVIIYYFFLIECICDFISKKKSKRNETVNILLLYFKSSFLFVTYIKEYLLSFMLFINHIMINNNNIFNKKPIFM